MVIAALSASMLLGSLSVGGPPHGGDQSRFGTHVGELYPPIVLPSLDGKRPLSLSMFAGKKVLLVQFASW